MLVLGNDSEAILDAAGVPAVAYGTPVSPDIAIPMAEALSRLESARHGMSLTASVPAEPSEDSALLVAIYPDAGYQKTSYWSSEIRYSLEKAAEVVKPAGIRFAYAVSMESYAYRMEPDIRSYCGLMHVADYEAMATDAGALVAVFSTGEKIADRWANGNPANGPYFAVTINEPVTAAFRGEDNGTNGERVWEDFCDGVPNVRAMKAQGRLPALYTHSAGYIPKSVVAKLFTHELAHAFTMQHGDAECGEQSGVLRKTLEAATSGGGVPPECGHYSQGDYNWRFSDTSHANMAREWGLWNACAQRRVTC